jgi:hypothetical protein
MSSRIVSRTMLRAIFSASGVTPEQRFNKMTRPLECRIRRHRRLARLRDERTPPAQVKRDSDQNVRDSESNIAAHDGVSGTVA